MLQTAGNIQVIYLLFASSGLSTLYNKTLNYNKIVPTWSMGFSLQRRKAWKQYNGTRWMPGGLVAYRHVGQLSNRRIRDKALRPPPRACCQLLAHTQVRLSQREPHGSNLIQYNVNIFVLINRMNRVKLQIIFYNSYHILWIIDSRLSLMSYRMSIKESQKQVLPQANEHQYNQYLYL